MRVVAGGPARETTSPMFALHKYGLEIQGGFGHRRKEDWVDVETRHEIVPDPGGERWTGDKIERVARVRQQFLDEYAETGTQLFLVDTDLILGPGVLKRMMEVDADVVYGVFWTEADWGQPEGSTAPNVWRVHPYNFDEPTWYALKAKGVNEVPVYGGGACTLIRNRGFHANYWPILESIRYCGGMWAGEDRTFNLGLETRSVRQVAVTGLPIYHCHHPHQQTLEGLELAKKAVGI